MVVQLLTSTTRWDSITAMRSASSLVADVLTTVLEPPPTCPFEIDTSFSQLYLDELRAGLLRDVTPAEFMVLSALRAFTNGETGKAWPTVERLVRETGLHRTTVMKAVEGLESKHRIYREGRDGSKSTYWPLIHLTLRDRNQIFGVIQLWSRTRAVRRCIELLQEAGPKSYAAAQKEHAERRWRDFFGKRLYAIAWQPDTAIRSFYISGIAGGDNGNFYQSVDVPHPADESAAALKRILEVAKASQDARQASLL